jgi:hypothetical protein
MPPPVTVSPAPRGALLRLPVALLAAAAAAGCGVGGARFAIHEENDVFNFGDALDTDRDYTQGARLAATLPEEDTPGWAKAAAAALPLFREGAPVHAGFLVGQEIYTPEDREAEVPPPDDRPYGAWAFAGVALQSPALDGDAGRRRDRLDTLELDFGVVGPAAQGERAQNSFHRLFGIGEANGWRTQIRDEAGVLLTGERRWRLLFGEFGDPGGLAWDAIPLLRVRAGSVRVDASGGALVRFGWNLPRDFGPLPVDSHGLRRGAPSPPPWFALHIGGEGRGVVHDLFLQGGVFDDRHGVTPRDFVWSASTGITLGWGPLSAHYGQTWLAPQFQERTRYHKVSLILVSWTVWF